jgi:hypothetical protein
VMTKRRRKKVCVCNCMVIVFCIFMSV